MIASNHNTNNFLNIKFYSTIDSSINKENKLIFIEHLSMISLIKNIDKSDIMLFQQSLFHILCIFITQEPKNYNIDYQLFYKNPLSTIKEFMKDRKLFRSIILQEIKRFIQKDSNEKIWDYFIKTYIHKNKESSKMFGSDDGNDKERQIVLDNMLTICKQNIRQHPDKSYIEYLSFIIEEIFYTHENKIYNICEEFISIPNMVVMNVFLCLILHPEIHPNQQILNKKIQSNILQYNWIKFIHDDFIFGIIIFDKICPLFLTYFHGLKKINHIIKPCAILFQHIIKLTLTNEIKDEYLILPYDIKIKKTSKNEDIIYFDDVVIENDSIMIYGNNNIVSNKNKLNEIIFISLNLSITIPDNVVCIIIPCFNRNWNICPGFLSNFGYNSKSDILKIDILFSQNTKHNNKNLEFKIINNNLYKYEVIFNILPLHSINAKILIVNNDYFMEFYEKILQQNNNFDTNAINKKNISCMITHNEYFTTEIATNYNVKNLKSCEYLQFTCLKDIHLNQGWNELNLGRIICQNSIYLLFGGKNNNIILDHIIFIPMNIVRFGNIALNIYSTSYVIIKKGTVITYGSFIFSINPSFIVKNESEIKEIDYYFHRIESENFSHSKSNESEFDGFKKKTLLNINDVIKVSNNIAKPKKSEFYTPICLKNEENTTDVICDDLHIQI